MSARPASRLADRGTSGAQKFCMPAEWERHDATWISWPHNRDDWPGKLGAIQWVYGEMVRKIAPGETVRILVNAPGVAHRARRVLDRVGVDTCRYELLRWQTDRGWLRDTGPIFVRGLDQGAGLAITRFKFNGWARYPNWQADGRIAARAARHLGLPLADVRVGHRPVVLEGGAIEVNGRGTLLATEECLLHPTRQVRNPGFDRDMYEQLFHRYLGATNILWLGRGIVGDDTHGHIDDLCRFVDERTIVLCQQTDAQGVDYHALEENRERLEGMRLENGSRPEVIRLPMPAPLLFDGRRLPASYANFYIANAAVLVPTFNDEQDRRALGTLAELFPDRSVVGIHAVDLIWGFGAVHCLTQQQPTVAPPQHTSSP